MLTSYAWYEGQLHQCVQQPGPGEAVRKTRAISHMWVAFPFKEKERGLASVRSPWRIAASAPETEN